MDTVTPQLTVLLMENIVIILVIDAILQAYAEAENLKDDSETAGEGSLYPPTKMAYKFTSLKHHQDFMKRHYLTQVMSILYHLMMHIIKHTLHFHHFHNSFSRTVQKNYYKTVENVKNINITSSKLYRTLIHQETNSQLKINYFNTILHFSTKDIHHQQKSKHARTK